MTTSTIDPNKIPPSTALSNANLTATYSAGSQSLALCTPQLGSGKWYWEFHMDSYTLGGVTGAAQEYAPLNNYTGADATGCGIQGNGHVFLNGYSGSSFSSYATGDTLCIALDMVNSRIWFRTNGGNWNNNATYNPSTNVGGFDISTAVSGSGGFLLPAVGLSTTGDKITANFGGSAFAQTAPSGFSAANTYTAVTTVSTIDPQRVATNVTLSGSNLVATSTAGGSHRTSMCTPFLVGGKWYWEQTMTAFTANANAVGAGVPWNALNTYPGNAAWAVGMNGAGSVYIGGSNISTVSGYVVGDTVGVALDLVNKNIWFRTNAGNWNNNATYSPVTNTGGISISGLLSSGGLVVCPAIGFYNNSDVFTMNFGASAFSHAAPSGFAAANTWAAPPTTSSVAYGQMLLCSM